MKNNGNWLKSIHEEVLNLHDKVELQIKSQYEADGYSPLECVLSKIEELCKDIKMLDPEAAIYVPVRTESEKKLKEIEDICSGCAKDVLDKACKRAIRQMNKWGAALIDPLEKFPSTFRVFDILSVELQSNYFCDINPLLEDAIENVLWEEYNALSYQERFFVEYSECFCEDCLDNRHILNLLHKHFMKLINEHWTNSKKIQAWYEKN